MKISDFPYVSELMRTKSRIEHDLALLEDFERAGLRMTGVELLWDSLTEHTDMLFHAEGRARIWASDDLHEVFSRELRLLIRTYLQKDMEYCHRKLVELGVQLDNPGRP